MVTSVRQGKVPPTRILNVLSAGASLASLLEASSWDGRISARFRSALQITGPQERLVYLQGGSTLVSPFSLRIEGSLGPIIADLDLEEGMPVRKEGPRLEMAGRLRLFLEPMRYYRSPVTGGLIDPEALRLAERTVALQVRPGGLDAMRAARKAAGEIYAGLRSGQIERVVNASTRLVGLGPGLTPSGDDFLVGSLKGLSMLGWAQRMPVTALAALRRGLTPLLREQTCRVGAAFIRHALHGQFAEVFDQAAATLLAPAVSEAVTSGIARLLGQGATSGSDTARGFLTTLDACLSADGKEQVLQC